MRKSVASFAHKMVALCAAFVLAFSMVPLVWADDGPAGTIAGTVAGNAAAGSENPEDAAATEGSHTQAPEAKTQSAATKAAEGSSTGGTTISIAVYRSSFDTAWNLNDGGDDAVKATYGTTELPSEVSPGVVATLPEGSDPTRPGYNFLGWNSKADGSGAHIGVDETPAPAEGEKLSFYAIWDALDYTIIFDLSKNPDDTALQASLAWPGHTVTESSKNVFRADGITVEDGPKGSVVLPDGKATKRTDYRFLGWAEGDGVPASQDDDGTWKLDLTTHPSGAELVLTARWAFKVGVIVPSDITFGKYDLLSQPGQGFATDETSSQDKLDGTDGSPGAGEAAYFQSSTFTADLELAGLQSKRSEAAEDVIFPKEGSLEAVFDQPLLSLFPLPSGADGAEAKGVHFKLDDEKDEDAFEGKGFGIPKESTDGTRGRLYASYRLNLDTAWSDGSQNAAIVGNSVTQGDVKTHIASITYEFALAGSSIEPSVHRFIKPTGSTDDALYVEVTDAFLRKHALKMFASGIYGTADIKEAANDLSAHSGDLAQSIYYPLYQALLEDAVLFMVKVSGTDHAMHLFGICQDTRSDTGTRAGLTLGWRDVYAQRAANSVGDAVAGWGSMPLRTYLQGDFYRALGADLQSAATGIVPVVKSHQRHSSARPVLQTTAETVFIPSFYEVGGQAGSSFNPSENASNSFQYQAFLTKGPWNQSPLADKHYGGSICSWYTRSGVYASTGYFCGIGKTPEEASSLEGIIANDASKGVVPCFAL
jgi:uncharacterized repeat protein (TIGR02543 family)